MTSAILVPVWQLSNSAFWYRSSRSWVRFLFKPEFFHVSSFQPLRLKNLHCDDLHIIPMITLWGPYLTRHKHWKGAKYQTMTARCVLSIKHTIFRRYLSKSPTVAKGSIFNVLPVLSIKELSPGARSNWNLSRRASTWVMATNKTVKNQLLTIFKTKGVFIW